MKLLFFLGFCFLFYPTYSQPWIHPDRNTTSEDLTLFFTGDVMQHAPQIKGAWDTLRKDYNYLPCFQYISPYWKKADYVFANLETALSNRNFSGYRQFCAPWQLARYLKESGVNILTTNYNHSCDKGAQGIKQTLYYLDSLNLLHTGTYTDSISWVTQTPLYIQHYPFKIALLSYTYGTNGIPVTQGQVVSMIDTLTMLRHINKAIVDSATNIIAVVHWGIEYQTSPTQAQKRLAHWLHSQGVDIVIGSHPHVVQPLEYVISGQDTTGITVYSLGNFVSNQSKRHTNGGISVELTLKRIYGRTRYQMRYLSHYVYRPLDNHLRRYYVIPEPLAPQILDEQDKVLYKEFFNDTDSIIGTAAGKLF